MLLCIWNAYEMIILAILKKGITPNNPKFNI